MAHYLIRPVEDAHSAVVLDVQKMVYPLQVVLQVYLFTVKDDLLAVYAVEGLMLDRKHPKQVRSRKSFEVFNSQHVHHAAFNQLASVQILPHYLSETQ